MLGAVATLFLLANTPATPTDTTTLPRHPDPDPVEQQTRREGEPTDPWFDREFVATDDPAFVRVAVESSRQGIVDARAAETGLEGAELRSAAVRILRQNEATSRKLEKLAGTKGWRLPQPNPARASTVNGGSAARASANFIVAQIAFHENTIAHYRAQIAGKGDADLRRLLREAVPGYQENLQLLLTIRPWDANRQASSR